MGLETVELAIAIEEEFNLELPDERLSSVYTVGDLYRVLAKELGVSLAGPCATQKVFYTLRELSPTPRAITPSSPVGTILSLNPLTESWSRLSKSLPYITPGLRRHWLTRKASVPATAKTVGGLAHTIVSLNYEVLHNARPRTLLWSRLRQTVSRALGIPPYEVLWHARFIEDLRCG